MRISLPAFALSRPITVTMLVITFIGLGAIALTRLPIEFIPAIDAPFLGCYIIYPGANPAQVEKEIAILAEGEFRTLPNIGTLYTNSNPNGCYVNISFKSGTDMNEAMAEMRVRIERLRLVLPAEVYQIRLMHFSSDSLPILMLGLFREGDKRAFVSLINDVLLPKLQRIDGVAEITLRGGDQPVILVEFDQNALRRQNLSIYQVMTTLQTASVNVSVGELLDGGTKYLVRVLDEFTKPSDMEDLIISPGIRLKDIATVGYRVRDDDYHFSLNDQEAVFLRVTKESQANTVATCDAVIEELDRMLESPEFEGVTKFLFMNQGDMIKLVLNGLLNAGKYGGLMALCVLFLFLRRLPPTVVVALAIPGSLVGGTIFMYFMGMSLNLITMMALIVAVGMVVDNSIVVVENIYRYRALGYDPGESARRGASEVAMAITAATLTTGVVFIPMVFIDAGEMAVMMKQFALPVTVSLACSLLIALTVIPLAVSRFEMSRSGRFMGRWFRKKDLDPSAPPAAQSRLRKAFSLSFWGGLLLAGYEHFMRFTMRRRLVTMALIAVFMAVTYYVPFKRVGLQELPTIDRREVSMDVRLDQNYDYAMAQEVFVELDAVVDRLKDQLGIVDVFKNYSRRGGQYQLFLKKEDDLLPGESLPYTSREVMDILSVLVNNEFPGGTIRFNSGTESTGGGGAASDSAKVAMLLQGDDLETLERYADRLVAVLESLPELSDVDTNTRPPEQEFQIDVDEVLARRAGISPTQVAQTVGFALQGRRMSDIKQNGKEIPVWAQFSEEDRKSKANLDNVMLQGPQGRLVPLHEIVTYSKADTPRSISRRDGKNYMWITATTASKDWSRVTKNLRHVRDSFELPTGYTLSLGDELKRMQADVESFLATLFLAVILIYLVMAALFESWFLPLSIMTTVPLAFVGAYWSMYLLDTPMDSIAFIGCILMVGIIVNNAIVIVDHINNLRKSGLDRFEAIIQAGKDRIRPVLMTALTTILGIIPLAIGAGPAREIVGLGRALIGGITIGTLLTLFVVPLAYTFIDDFQDWARQYIAGLGDLTGRKAEAEEAN